MVAHIHHGYNPKEIADYLQIHYFTVRMYEIKGKLTGPNGKSLTVCTIWMTENETGNTKFITMYPNKGRYINDI
jgi:hypothetical protein